MTSIRNEYKNMMEAQVTINHNVEFSVSKGIILEKYMDYSHKTFYGLHMKNPYTNEENIYWIESKKIVDICDLMTWVTSCVEEEYDKAKKNIASDIICGYRNF